MLKVIWRTGVIVGLVSVLTSCAHPNYEVNPLSRSEWLTHVNQCRTLAIALPPKEAEKMVRGREFYSKDQGEAFVGGAAPVSANGHFITAYHVAIPKEGYQLVLIYSASGEQKFGLAKVVWTDKKHDLALMKADFATPEYFRWSPRGRDLPEGTQIFHAGMKTGNKGELGELSERVSGSWSSTFKHTLHLEQGDSGGPVLLTSGELVGVNSSIGFFNALDTSFFDSAQSSRPDPAVIDRVIAKDSQ